MTRKEVSLPQQSASAVPEVKARMADTYVRPSAREAGTLEGIAETLVSINPKIQQYLHKQEEAKKEYDLAMGAKLYRQMQGEGKDLSATEIGQMVERGEIEGFRRLSKHMREGVVRERHKVLGESLEQHMLNWYPNATIDGTPIASVEDQGKVSAAYNQEQARYIQEVTEGKYDPRLYQELVAGPAKAAMNQFIQRQASNRLIEQRNYQSKTMTMQLDNMLDPLLASDSLASDPDRYKPNMVTAFNSVMKSGMSLGMTHDEAVKFTAKYLQTKMQSGISMDYIDILRDTASLIPDFDSDPQLMYSIYVSADNAKQNLVQERSRRKQMERDDAEDAATEFLNEIRETGKVDSTKVNELRKRFAKYGGEMAAILSGWAKFEQEGFDTSVRMSSEQFYTLRTQAKQGNISQLEAVRLFPQMSAEQQDELNSVRYTAWSQNKTIAAATGGGNRGGKALDQLTKEINKRVGAYFKTDTKGFSGSQLEGYNATKAQMVSEITVEIVHELEKDPTAKNKANEYEFIKSQCIDRVGKRYAPYLTEYADNPALLKHTPQQAHAVILKDKVQSKMAILGLKGGQQKALLDEMANGVTPEHIDRFRRAVSRNKNSQEYVIFKSNPQKYVEQIAEEYRGIDNALNSK